MPLKLVIPKLLFILVLCNFNSYIKIMQPPPPPKKKINSPPNNITPPPPPKKILTPLPSKDFSKIFKSAPPPS